MNKLVSARFKVRFSLLIFIFMGSISVGTAHAQSEVKTFFVESAYHAEGKNQLEAILIQKTNSLYIYAEKKWWESLSSIEENSARLAIFDLGAEFQNTIYPKLTGLFGKEPQPGIDGDNHITVLIHRMSNDAGGYFNSGDVYSKLQYPRSNEREMVYLNSKYIGRTEVKNFLAHEFMHLITLNQKDVMRRVTEDVWLNEARAEYAPAVAGYDSVYEGSNLQRRVKDFLRAPSDSLTDWQERPEDYGVSRLFTEYLVDHYGKEVLVDSLKSNLVGIVSVTEALKKNGFKEDFSEVYENWAIAVLVNDCSLGKKYCYKNKKLSDLRIIPALYVLPSAETIFSTYHSIPDWSANWHRLVGGGESLAVKFIGTGRVEYRVPYVLCDHQDVCSIHFFSLDSGQNGEISFSDFNTTYGSLTLIPMVAGIERQVNGSKNAFSWEVFVKKDEGIADDAVKALLSRITQLQEQVRQLQAQISVSRASTAVHTQTGERIKHISCAKLDYNLSFGMANERVRCLQEFLNIQGKEIYPEGLVTGYFGLFTKQAVVRLQERYFDEILSPLGLSNGTGFVGLRTRSKFNELLSS